jgi:hypothetical protein
MTLKEINAKLDLLVRCGEEKLNQEVTGGYAGDLLSDVMANSKAGNLWITMQVHVNTVAVAVLKELSAIVLVQGREPAEDTLKRARDEHVVILVSKQPTFEVVGRLYELGIGKKR